MADEVNTELTTDSVQEKLARIYDGMSSEDKIDLENATAELMEVQNWVSGIDQTINSLRELTDDLQTRNQQLRESNHKLYRENGGIREAKEEEIPDDGSQFAKLF